MKILAVIPARYAAQRLPGKPLAIIDNRPMVQWVYQAARRCTVFDEVIVATESEDVAACVRGFGGRVEMTRSDHLSGTDRVAEVAARYEAFDVVANVQGDLPFVTPQVLTQLISPYLEGESPDMTTLACPLNLETGYPDPNIVKVLLNRQQYAIYFSRSPIPHFRNPGTAPVYHHLGLYAFRRDFLADYAQLTATPLELCEGLEQLRVLENGYSIRVCQIDAPVMEVNTPEDLDRARLQLVGGATP
ncbi:MAG: 3-deoxy-manno-octulosonate cytidylyltransferase [Elainellaceae cyanobacterium]